MTKNFIEFRDAVRVQVDPDSFKDITDTSSSTPKVLRVELVATHAGKLINNRVYLPSKMRKGASTFTDGYNKPFLTHHNKNSDPIGRVVEASYVDTINIIQQKYSKDFFSDAKENNFMLLDSFVKGRMSFKNEVKFLTDSTNQQLLLDKTYQGLGYIRLVANISDKAAQEKFLDGRYATFSVGARTNHGVCSSCKQDFVVDGQCDCDVGTIVDGKPVYIITGDLSYGEISSVNEPADNTTPVVSLHYDDKIEEIGGLFEDNREPQVMTLTLTHVDITDTEEEQVAKKEDKTVETVDTETEEQQVVDTEATETEDSTEETTAEETVEDTTVEDTETEQTELTDEELIAKAISEEDLTDEEHERLYEVQWGEVKDCASDLGFSDEEMADAKLSAEGRKKLVKSKFCGPKRSFPVHDCAHVTAARRLIGRYKGPGDKSAIMACVDRKAKALGCKSEKAKDSVEQTDSGMDAANVMSALLGVFGTNSWSKEEVLSKEDKDGLRTVLKKLAGLVGKDSLAEAAAEEKLGLDVSTEDALCEHIVQLEDKVGELSDHLSALREEYTLQSQDLGTLQDELVEEKSKHKSSKERLLSTLKTLDTGVLDEEDMSGADMSVLDSEIDRLASKVDIISLVDKMNNGMARNPQGEVDDPTVLQDNQEEGNKLTKEDHERLQKEMFKISFTKGPAAASKYMKDQLASRGLVVTDDR